MITGTRLCGSLRNSTLALVLLTGGAHAAPGYETSAPRAVLIDYDTGTVLFEKDADRSVPPASLAKLMTVEVVFRELKQGRWHLDDEFTVSENAWRRGGASSGGSTMFLPLHARVKLGDLIQGIIIQSGNDACIVVAEALAGSEAGFAEVLNRRAQEIGLLHSHFADSNGLPDPDERVTMRDLATLAAHIIREYPDYYHYFGEQEFTFNKIKQGNRNPLLTMGIGADGLKTGHTAEAGFGLVGSAVRNGQRLIVAMNGMKSAKERAEEGRKLLEWGFRAFEPKALFEAGQTVGEAEVFGGEEDKVAAVPQRAIKLLVPRGSGNGLHSKMAYSGPIQAPVAQGQRLGTLQVMDGDAVVLEAPLYAAKTVERGSLFRRAWQAVRNLIRNHI